MTYPETQARLIEKIANNFARSFGCPTKNPITITLKPRTEDAGDVNISTKCNSRQGQAALLLAIGIWEDLFIPQLTAPLFQNDGDYRSKMN